MIDEEIELKKDNVKHIFKIIENNKKIKTYYREKYARIFKFCDILIIFAILFNFGAIGLTNAMVVKNNPEIVLYEVNPHTSKAFNYTNPVTENVTLSNGRSAKESWNGIIIHMLKLMVLITGYVFLRFNVKSEYQLYFMLSVAGILFVMLTFDFTNDFGFWVGKLIWGS